MAATRNKRTPAFHEIGDVADELTVKLSYRIIKLFSEGLYSSPNKALEELVSNSFDAGATDVFVFIDPDLRDAEAAIAVVDNGCGMDIEGLRQHWIVGSSTKRREEYLRQRGRKPIGKFGIGKLASYVLADRLTHISKADGRYFSTSIDYRAIPDDLEGGSDHSAPSSDSGSSEVKLDIRELSREQAEEAVGRWLQVRGRGRKTPMLFGRGSPEAWTVAVMSELKPLALELSLGRLGYVLRTAMPLRDDFKLHLNGKVLRPSKIDQPIVGRWVLGQDLTEPPKPAPDDFEVSEDPGEPTGEGRWGLTHSTLGRVWGYVEVFVDPIDKGKSAERVGRSNGFFVYAHGRLLNTDDAGFGIDRNLLRHGTFSRMRAVVHIDRLDEELRSSRESMREGPILTTSRQLLHGLFNFARGELQADEAKRDPSIQFARRLADSPASLTELPIIRAIDASLRSGEPLRTIRLPADLTGEERELFVESLIKRAEDGGLVTAAVHADLSGTDFLAAFDAETGELQINALHPFVGAFIDDFQDQRRNLPLELLSMSEVLLEAGLRRSPLDRSAVDAVLNERDELLRFLARKSGRSSALMAAADLLESVGDQDALEEALVGAFDSLGYNAVRKGGKSNPDGIAEAPLAARDGATRGYKVSLEAKSKRDAGARVSKDAVKVSTIARHRNQNGCQHAIVVGQEFSTERGDESAVIEEIEEDVDKYDGARTITLMRAEDLARLVRVAPTKRVTPADLRALFESCRSPEEASVWVDGLTQRAGPDRNHQDILEVIWEEQGQDQSEHVSYGALRSALRRSRDIQIREEDLKAECQALSRMAPGHVYGPYAMKAGWRPRIEAMRRGFHWIPAWSKRRSR